jgi:hypothetical protein
MDCDRFESGVSGYVWGVATVKNPFPKDMRGIAEICCSQCFYFRRTAPICNLNGEICAFPNKYVGANCPFNYESEDK